MSAGQSGEEISQDGGAADLVRVEVLVPPSARKDIVALAAQRQHRDNKKIRALYDAALQSYRTRILDNVDLDRLPDLRSAGGRRGPRA